MYHAIGNLPQSIFIVMCLDLKWPWQHISGCVYDSFSQNGRLTFIVGHTIPKIGVLDQFKNEKRAEHRSQSLLAFCACNETVAPAPAAVLPILMNTILKLWEEISHS